MAQVANDSANPDVSLLRTINGLARQAPRGVDRTVEFAGQYGLLALTALLAGWCWWRVARRSADAPAAVAGVLWACLAAGVAVLLNIPIRALVRRPRPAVDHDGLDVIVPGHHTMSFVSDHATLTAAVAVGLFMVSRKAGLVAAVLALAEGFTRVYLGTHYPTDVVGGFALGAATVLLLAPPALAGLTVLTRAVARTRASFLVLARPEDARGARAAAAHHWHRADDKDLAA
ncbi:MAG: phosphatase PAP2 family protein [Streptomyces sp.]|nr:phosphatase PAP2 family protein [Streptomyces sp.]